MAQRGGWFGVSRESSYGIFRGVARALDETVGASWQDAHEHAADRRTVNRLARYRKDHPESDTYIEAAQRRHRPIDEPRRGTRDDVRDPNFHGTYTEKTHWWWGKSR
jgi:hypothetical protein